MFNKYGYVRVGAVVPSMKVADVEYNVKMIVKALENCIQKGIQIVSFPELSITGYTCQDLFFNEDLLCASRHAIRELCAWSQNKDIVFIVGSPLSENGKLYNTAVVIQNGKILGIVPKRYLPNRCEFYEARWFSILDEPTTINLCNQEIPFGENLIFSADDYSEIKFGIEICEDLWGIKPQSDELALNGANIIFNLSASPDIVTKSEYRYNLVKMQSAKLMSGYVYASSGVNESSTDLIYSGDAMIFENGQELIRNADYTFDTKIIFADIDCAFLESEKRNNSTYSCTKSTVKCQNIQFRLCNSDNLILSRKYNKYPFIPRENAKKVCNDILNMQSYALAKRLKSTNINKVVIGVSGGLDSTLALIVCKRAMEILNLDKTNIIAVSMPCFGTSSRTYNNAIKLIDAIGATSKIVDIKKTCLQHFKDIGLQDDDTSVAFENAQARERTQVLMDISNMENAIVVGTGDLSELALGYCTYTGDHISGYAVNVDIPKTLVRSLIASVAEDDNKLKDILFDILDTPISPELLPTNDGEIVQKTEEIIGDYSINDFILYHFLRRKSGTRKIAMLLSQTFDMPEDKAKVAVNAFMRRFFNNQFKRSCLPDGVKVGSVSLSPRGDYRLSSDVSSTLWSE